VATFFGGRNLTGYARGAKNVTSNVTGVNLFIQKGVTLMDETTKVLIATISGFIIAFFAEPVKAWFQNRAKVRELRLALYKEIFLNYSYLAGENKDKIFSKALVQHAMQNNCYQYAINSEIKTFYKVKEAATINNIYTIAYFLTGVSDGTISTPIQPDIREGIELYVSTINIIIKSGDLDKKIVAQCIGKETLKEIMSKPA
jgi:hypothetical protein